jgi:hypothetical protein
METTATHENFPVRIVLLSNLVSLLIYGSGLFILSGLSWIAVVVFLAFILVLEYRIIGRHCINCYYFGKVCGFGKGRISSLLFTRGDPSKFCSKPMTWKDMIPDLLITLIPLVTGIILMIMEFDFIILGAVILLIGLSSAGNGYIRGSLTCRYCKQRILGCPAEQLFSRGQGSTEI